MLKRYKYKVPSLTKEATIIIYGAARSALIKASTNRCARCVEIRYLI